MAELDFIVISLSYPTADSSNAQVPETTPHAQTEAIEHQHSQNKIALGLSPQDWGVL